MDTEAKVQHTAGPWTLETVKTQVGICHKIGPFPPDSGGRENYACVYVDAAIPGVSENDPREAELRANAVLMAAAPDLLESVTAIVGALDDAKVDDMPAWWAPWWEARSASVRAAIAKASGDTP